MFAGGLYLLSIIQSGGRKLGGVYTTVDPRDAPIIPQYLPIIFFKNFPKTKPIIPQN